MTKRIVVLGGGFGGVYAARALERALRRDRDIEITLVNKDNFFLFTPMLHEVAASDLDVTHIVNPIRKLLRRTSLFHGDVLGVDLEQRVVHVSHGLDEPHPHELPFDHLVVALGSVTNFHGTPGLAERAMTMRTLGDAIALRNRLVVQLEEADFECCPHVRQRCLTFVVAGGGFAGVETIAAIHDFVVESLRYYRNLSPEDVRMVLVHSGKTILPELEASLGDYARRKLAARGVEIALGTRVAGLTEEGVELSDGTIIPTRSLIWTAGTAPHPLAASLPVRKQKGRIEVDATLAVPDQPGVWALGDCALVPDGRGGFHPPTAQHACRQGQVVAANIARALRAQPPRPFTFRTLGQLASLGRRTGVAQVFGLRFSGFVAWWLWRTIYLLKLPRFERKVRVALDWTLDLLFSKDLVQSPTVLAPRFEETPPARAQRSDEPALPALVGSGQVA